MSPKRKLLAKYGHRGDQVRVRVDKRRNRVEVYYRDHERIERKRIFSNDAEGKSEAIAWAESYHTERARIENELKNPAKREPITLRELWDRFVASPAYTKDIRHATRVNYRDRWKKWEAFMKPEAIVDNTTLDDVDRFRIACEAAGIVINSVRQILNVVRTIYNWGQSRKLITNNELALFKWKTPKDAKVMQPGDYSTAEWEAMLRTFRPGSLMDGSYFAAKNWRPWVTMMLIGHHGQRWQAVRHLNRTTDIDWEAGTITWRAEFQKQGKDVVQPITHGLLSALIVAQFWAARHLVMRPRRRVRVTDGPRRGKWIRDPELKDVPIDSPWLLFAERDKMQPYSYSSFHHQFMKAERDAVIVVDGEKRKGITHEAFRAGHGGRRMVVGNLLEATQDPMVAMNYVGDTDVAKQLGSYDKRMKGRIAKGAESIEEGR